MRTHPALNMIYVWVWAFAAFFLLPFKLENRSLSVYGFLVFLLFIAVFCVAGLIKTKPLQQMPRARNIEYDFIWIDRILIVAAILAIVSLALDLRGKDVADLAAAYIERSDRADALLHGDVSNSSIYFKIGFMFYPAANIYVAREVIFERNIRIIRLAFFGALPIVLATLTLGGRSPLFYALLVGLLSYRLRREIFPKILGASNEKQRIIIGISFILSAVSMAIYFINVFFIRSQTDGDDSALFDVARNYWGISFNGYGSDFFFQIFGLKATYTIFVFTWYLVQGIVMSNILFTQYNGGLQYGIYGTDLATAIARRINGEFVAERFDSLLKLNTYGFLPSAFGSLYVDFAFYGLIFCAFWGWWAASVYKHYKCGFDHRWMMVAPFVNLGIFFSLINTPLGLTNGLVTHFWLFVGFKAIRKRQLVRSD